VRASVAAEGFTKLSIGRRTHCGLLFWSRTRA
jgi:hypothetical protein